MNEKLRVKPILIGVLVSFLGNFVVGIIVAAYAMGGVENVRMFAEKASTLSLIGLTVLGALICLIAGYVTARVSPHSPGRHVKWLAIIIAVAAALQVLGGLDRGVGIGTAIGVVSVALSSGAALLGGRLGTPDTASRAHAD